MMKTIKGDLVLTKDTTFRESITVEGNIRCKDIKFNLTVDGDIKVRDITALDITAGNIKAVDITALDINAYNIKAWDIDAWDIICVSRKKRHKESKTIAYSIILDRHKRKKKEVMMGAE